MKSLASFFLLIIAALAVHALVLFFSTSSAIGWIDFGINYLLLLVLFGAGQFAVFSQKSTVQQKETFKRFSIFRLILAALFLVVSTMASEHPLAKSLHFIIPFFVFSLAAWQQVQNLLKAKG